MQLQGATVAVTGVTGFLGRYLVEVLLHRGARVIGVVRNPDRAPELAELGVELRRADLAEPEQLAAGFIGADALISNAALLSLRNYRYEDYIATNVRGTRNVFEAAAAAGISRVVQISSVSVYRRGRTQGPVNEEHTHYSAANEHRPWNAYAISKALAEAAAWELAARHDMALTALRPCAIYGAFDQHLMRVFKLATTVLPISVYPCFTRLPVVYAGDVAEAAALSLEIDPAVGRAYNVTGEDRTAWDLKRDWKRAGGKTPWFSLPIPAPLRRTFDHGRARTELGWRNRPVVEGLREMLAAERAGSRARRLILESAGSRGSP